MRILSNFVLAFALLVSVAVWTTYPVRAQASGNGVFVLLQAGIPASCTRPAGATVTNGMAICATTSGPYYALNGSTTFLPFAATGVSAFNGRSGAVTLTKADVLGTNFTISSTVQ